MTDLPTPADTGNAKPDLIDPMDVVPREATQASRFYTEILAQLAGERPRTAAALDDAERRRYDKLLTLLDGSRLAGCEELFEHLDRTAVSWSADPALARLSFLPARLIADYETALEASLSGYITVALDAMRDVMEVENLLLDFTTDSALIDQWLTADQRTLRRTFAPAAVRARLHKAGVGRYQDSAESLDYRGHSIALHVSPSSPGFGLFTKGRLRERSFESDVGFWELFEHARRILIALDKVRVTLAAQPALIPAPNLPAVHNAWRRTQEMQHAWIALLEAAGVVPDIAAD